MEKSLVVIRKQQEENEASLFNFVIGYLYQDLDEVMESIALEALHDPTYIREWVKNATEEAIAAYSERGK